MSFSAWKTSVLGQKLTEVQGIKDPYGVQCVVVAWHYANYLFPKISIRTSITTGNAKDIFSGASSKCFLKITNDHANASQLPKSGDIMVFGATPASGYTNRFDNPDGHAGVCDGATSDGYWLIQQNAPRAGQAVNRTWYAWKYRPCIGWLRPIPPTPTTPPKTNIVINKGTWYVRKNPDGAVVRTVGGGQHYTATIGSNGWACIGTGQYVGPAAYKKA